MTWESREDRWSTSPFFPARITAHKHEARRSAPACVAPHRLMGKEAQWVKSTNERNSKLPCPSENAGQLGVSRQLSVLLQSLNIYTHTHVHISTCTCNSHGHICTFTHIHMHTHFHTYAHLMHLDMCMHAQRYTCKHIHTCTPKHT
jgi:hypothetical protein